MKKNEHLKSENMPPFFVLNVIFLGGMYGLYGVFKSILLISCES